MSKGLDIVLTREIQRVQALCEAKNHGLVLKDAALERSALGIVNSSFGCAGLVKFARERKVGCAHHPETDLGPVVSADHKKSVIDWINERKPIRQRVVHFYPRRRSLLHRG
ncbi:MAG: hypothetical protein VR68_15455 [Peptococcaceae bacterium BRH_c4a]|nr:MAG: hypothetical protein VR68_15455 [Peptococcaceae bacterium BRH_c4a]